MLHTGEDDCCLLMSFEGSSSFWCRILIHTLHRLKFRKIMEMQVEKKKRKRELWKFLLRPVLIGLNTMKLCFVWNKQGTQALPMGWPKQVLENGTYIWAVFIHSGWWVMEWKAEDVGIMSKGEVSQVQRLWLAGHLLKFQGRTLSIYVTSWGRGLMISKMPRDRETCTTIPDGKAVLEESEFLRVSSSRGCARLSSFQCCSFWPQQMQSVLVNWEPRTFQVLPQPAFSDSALAVTSPPGAKCDTFPLSPRVK